MPKKTSRSDKTAQTSARMVLLMQQTDSSKMSYFRFITTKIWIWILNRVPPKIRSVVL